MFNQTQFTTQEKREDLGKKYIKRHLQKNNLLCRQPQVLKSSTKKKEKKKKKGTRGPISPKPPLPLAGQRYIGKECLNIRKASFPSSNQS